MTRVILHSDLNNFYASVECLYNPEIRTHPVAVCGSQSTRHGIVLVKNQVAKKFGVKSGEAIWEAWSKNIRMLGVRVTDVVMESERGQISFFDDERRLRREQLESSIDLIRSRFGHYSVQRAVLLKSPDLNTNPVEENVFHPVSFFR